MVTLASAVRQDSRVTGDIYPNLNEHLAASNLDSQVKTEIWRFFSKHVKMTNFTSYVGAIKELQRFVDEHVAIYGERHIRVSLLPYFEYLRSLYERRDALGEMIQYIEHYWVNIDNNTKQIVRMRMRYAGRVLERYEKRVKAMIERISAYDMRGVDEQDEVEELIYYEERMTDPFYLDPMIRPVTP